MCCFIGIAIIFDDYFSTVVIFLQNKSQFTIKMCNFAVIKARILIFYGT